MYKFIMKTIWVTVLILHYASSRPAFDKDAQTISYENFNDGTGNYHFAYQTTNGIKQEQSAYITNGVPGTTTQGSFSVITRDNYLYEVRYAADENGFRPYVVIKSSPNVYLPISRTIQERPSTVTKTPEKTTIIEGKQTKDETNRTTETNKSVPLCNSTTTTMNPFFKETVGNRVEGNSSEAPCINFDDRIGTKAQITILGKGG